MHKPLRAVAGLIRLLPLLFVLGGATRVAACSDPTSPSGGCCKIGKEGKPCGDSCISKSDTCHKGAGCACSG